LPYQTEVKGRMKIKRFFARDMRQVIRNIREELGSDAVILSNRKVEGGIEIVSAVDYDEALFTDMTGSSPGREPGRNIQDSEAESVNFTNPDAEVSETARPGKKSRQVEWMEDPMLVQMSGELKTLRDVLESQLSHLSQSDAQRRDPEHAAVFRRLEKLGIEVDLAHEFISQLDPGLDLESSWRQSLGYISHQLQVTSDDILSRGGVVALVGPTGVGKTTTIAKLAARFSLRHGNRQVALISADSYRIGAQEQLQNFGRILDVPTYSVNNACELSDRLQDLHDKRLVLIDTAGMSQRDMRLTEQLQTLDACSSLIKTYLVMSANTQTSTLNEVIRSFRKSNLKGCILSKLDETTSLGGAISTILRYQLPIAYISDGQRVPEDLYPARSHTLVSKAVTLMQQQEGIAGKYPNKMNLNRKMANAHG